MLVKFCLFLAAVFPTSVYAADNNLEFPLKAGEKMVISATDAQLNITVSPATKLVKILFPEGGEGDFQIDKKEGFLELRSRDQLIKSEFGKASGKKRRDIEIFLPPTVNLEAHLLDGIFTLSKMSKDALIQMQKGKLVVKDCQGATLNLNMQKGEALVQDCQAKLNLDSYSAHVTVRNFTGDVELQNFSGESLIEKAKGFLNLNQGSGNTRILASSGGLQFELGKGILTSQLFLGRIDGQNGEGSVNLNLSPESDVNVKSQAGKVSIQTAANSGSMLHISTAEGEIYGPSYLKVGRDNAGKTLRGRIKGEQQKSTIVVRGQEAVIVIK